VLSLYKQALDAHVSHTVAKAALTAALLASIGSDNETYLEATMHPVPVYSLSPLQIVDAMFTKHGQTTGPDLQKLRDPLLKLLPVLAELETHMNLFMLASIKLTASGHGENPYRYFEMFLESVKGFPVLRQQLPGFFTMYPTVNQQNVTVLFAFLRPLITHMMAESSSSPFSGAATAPPKTATNRRQKQRKTPKGRKHDWNTWTNSGQPAFPPHFAGSFQQAQTPPAFLGQDREAAYVAELQRCYAEMAITAPAEHVFAAAGNTWNQNGSSANGTTGSRLRQFYCGLHGWNNSHNSPQCRVMLEDASYPAALGSATTHEGTGGNPPPVSFRCPPPFVFAPSLSPSNTCSPACLSLNSNARARDSQPDEDIILRRPRQPCLAPSLRGTSPDVFAFWRPAHHLPFHLSSALLHYPFDPPSFVPFAWLLYLRYLPRHLSFPPTRQNKQR
jgi:hypothetical protein